MAILAVAYVPFLVSSPGRVSADSKQYLYLDPGRFLSRAADLWDPTIGAGTVPHQHLGYVVPMGPWFWVFERLGVPDWVAQRLWLGTLAAAALLGARWLFAQLGTGRSGALAGALVYGLTPYQLAFTARQGDQDDRLLGRDPPHIRDVRLACPRIDEVHAGEVGMPLRERLKRGGARAR